MIRHRRFLALGAQDRQWRVGGIEGFCGDWDVSLVGDAAEARLLSVVLLVDRLHHVRMVTRDRCKQFTAGFWAGLAAPTALFEAPVSYPYYVAANSIHRAFGQVAWHVNNAMSAYREQSGHSSNTPR